MPIQQHGKLADEPLDDMVAQDLAYIELLLEYPIDIALEVIRQWPRKNKFWPAWCELQDRIEAEIRPLP
jgi:hypothetical protein